MSWNGLSFTAAAELAGRAHGSGAWLATDRPRRSQLGRAARVASFVDATSWRAGFALTALAPLAGLFVLRSLGR